MAKLALYFCSLMNSTEITIPEYSVEFSFYTYLYRSVGKAHYRPADLGLLGSILPGGKNHFNHKSLQKPFIITPFHHPGMIEILLKWAYNMNHHPSSYYIILQFKTIIVQLILHFHSVWVDLKHILFLINGLLC